MKISYLRPERFLLAAPRNSILLFIKETRHLLSPLAAWVRRAQHILLVAWVRRAQRTLLVVVKIKISTITLSCPLDTNPHRQKLTAARSILDPHNHPDLQVSLGT